MRAKDIIGFLMLGGCMALSSCQKVILEDKIGTTQQGNKVAIRFNVMQIEQVPFGQTASTRGTDVKEICSKLHLAVYKDTKKINQINQTSADADYGTMNLSLAPGTYRIVLIAHNGAKSPTMANPAKITFDNKVTDTFYYSEEITVAGTQTYNISLKRAVAAFRLAIKDNIPDQVQTFHFYYTGGSSTFDAIHGIGCVNSRQSEIRKVTTDMHDKPASFDIYTFPKSNNNKLKITVKAMSSDLMILSEKEFTDVDIRRNLITRYEGYFFRNSSNEGEDTEKEGGGFIHEGEGSSNVRISLNLISNEEWALINKSF